MTKKSPSDDPALAHATRVAAAPHSHIIERIENLLMHACADYLTNDVVEYGASLYPLPSDGGWAPSVFLYVMIQPVGDADGAHMGQFVSPYQLTQELVDVYVKEFAETTAASRKRMRALRAAGAEPALGVADD